MIKIKNYESSFDIKKLAITKRLNFLLGSGVSSPAVKLMSQCKGKNTEERNKELIDNVKKISKSLLNNSYSEITEEVLNNYEDLILNILAILNLSNSRQVPRSANIFTTNYDLFIEKSIDLLSFSNRFVFNDGTTGYFNNYLDSANFNKSVAYKGINDNYSDELPIINLIKPHGSINWIEDNGIILVDKKIANNPVTVPPTGVEGADTFMNNHFHEMLRIFQFELDKPQSLLIVLGFSFQDKHIGKMITRALKNPELLVIAFGYTNEDNNTYLSNLGFQKLPPNFRIYTPADFIKNDNEELIRFTLKEFNEIFKLGDGYFEQ